MRRRITSCKVKYCRSELKRVKLLQVNNQVSFQLITTLVAECCMQGNPPNPLPLYNYSPSYVQAPLQMLVLLWSCQLNFLHNSLPKS